MTDRLLDANEVAEWFGVPLSWVRESTRSGAMPCVELGRSGQSGAIEVIDAWDDEFDDEIRVSCRCVDCGARPRTSETRA